RPSSRNDLIRSLQELRGDGEANRLRCLEVDREVELRRLLHGKVGRLGPFENLVHKFRGALALVGKIRPMYTPCAQRPGCEQRAHPVAAADSLTVLHVLSAPVRILDHCYRGQANAYVLRTSHLAPSNAVNATSAAVNSRSCRS